MPTFAFTSVAYAFAIAIHDDPSIVQKTAWFEDALSWKHCLPSEKQCETYEHIASAVWQPQEVKALEDIPPQDSCNEDMLENSSANQLLSSCKHFLDCKYIDLVDQNTADHQFSA